MPLSNIQSEILRLLASHRDPESYAGGAPLARNSPRYSADIDIFHDREERVAQAAQQDSAFLQQQGFALKWLRRDPLVFTYRTHAGQRHGHWPGSVEISAAMLERYTGS